MDIESFANAHPLAYVHIAYAVVVLLHLGFVSWIAVQWRKIPEWEKATEPAQVPDSVVPRSHA